MHGNLLFKLVISDSDNADSVLAEINCPYDAFGSVLSYLQDSPLLNDFFKYAVLHPAPTVRENIACKDKISEEVFKILAEDKSITVLRDLTRSESFRKFANEHLVRRLIELDSECARNIADNYELLEQVDSDVILQLLVNSEDPTIRYALVSNYAAPKRVVKMFLEDREIQVSDEAKRRLEN